MSADAPRLQRRTIGTSGPPVVLLHGLLGQGKNLATAAAALAAPGRRVTLLDLPDHGSSPWSDRLDYESLARTVARELRDDAPVALLGHSMGGKTAMQVALRAPELLSCLVVVDIAPVRYAGGESEHRRHLTAMLGTDLTTVQSRADADARLAEHVHDARVRAFLLQNLARTPEGWRWRANLDLLARDLTAIADFPVPDDVRPYDGPVLWIAGADSRYVREEHRERMTELFPRARLVRIKGAGHWVHAEAPELFAATVERFLADVEGRA